jgi:hypothetical protein
MLAGGVGVRQNFDQRILSAHNRERNTLGVGSLTWNDDLAKDARHWARHLAANGKFEHSGDYPGAEPQGENLWAGTAGYYQPETMVGLWVDEKRDYKPGVFPNNSRSGSLEAVAHYTQLIWRRTQKVGCAIERGRQEDVLVCRYSTAGNVVGQRPI